MKAIPSRHIQAALWGAWLMAVLMALAIDRGTVEAIQGIGLGFGAFFLAVGGSAAARHYGAQEPSGGRAPTPGSQGEG